MQVLLVSVGTLGDTLPYLLLGRELRRRGHDVALLGNGAYRDQAGDAGLEFVELISAAESEREARQRARWSSNPWAAVREGFANLARDVEPAYRAIAERYEPRRTVVVAAGIMFGARIAREKLDFPLVTLHLQPCCFRSLRDVSYWSPWVPSAFIRASDYVTDLVIDFHLQGPINRLRRELGLPKIRRIMDRWWNSPDLTIGAFPDFLAPPQIVGPRQVRFLGFATPTADHARPPDERLLRFLAEHPRPIVVCPTSAVGDAKTFLAAAIAAAGRLDRPIVVLTPHGDQLPASLPATAAHFHYAPLSELLPAASAIVHNGGIGTCAAALQAAVPQIIVPRIVDQPDNARRLQRLGAAAVVPPHRLSVERLTGAVRTMLESSAVADRCRALAAECRRYHCISALADTVESLHAADVAADAGRSSRPTDYEAVPAASAPISNCKRT
jgi:rhamnosyltransferase subunit B